MGFLIKFSPNKTILGIKIECFGKWKQTNTNRKQKLTFVVGQLQTQTLIRPVFVGVSTLKSKWGLARVCVTICYKTT
jgi:hypothetical protein